MSELSERTEYKVVLSDWCSTDLDVHKSEEREECGCHRKVGMLGTHPRFLQIRCYSSEQVFQPSEALDTSLRICDTCAFCLWCPKHSIPQPNHPVDYLDPGDLHRYVPYAEDETGRAVFKPHIRLLEKGFSIDGPVQRVAEPVRCYASNYKSPARLPLAPVVVIHVTC